MKTSISISRRGSFRYETTSSSSSEDCKGVCVLSSNTDGKHIITSTVHTYTPKDYKDIGDSVCHVVYNDSKEHDDHLHCQSSIEYDSEHGHLAYKDRKGMMIALKKRFPQEHHQIVKTAKRNQRQRNNEDLDYEIYSLKNPSTAQVKRSPFNLKQLFSSLAKPK